MSDEKSDKDQSEKIAIDIAARIKAGDHSAEAEFVSEYGPGLLTMLRMRMRFDSRVDDVYQDVLIIVLQRLRGDGLDQPEKLPAFIQGVAVKVIAGKYRKDHDFDTQPDMDKIGVIQDHAPSTVHQISTEQSDRAARTLLKKLPNKRYREILFRHYVLGESKSWICGAMELTPQNFDRVIHRARYAFRKLLEDKGIDSVDDLFDEE